MAKANPLFDLARKVCVCGGGCSDIFKSLEILRLA